MSLKDRASVIDAVRQFGGFQALSMASDEVRADKKAVLVAVHDIAAALHFVSPALRDDHDVAFAAISNDAYVALPLLSDSLKNDRQIILSAIRHDPLALRHAPEHMRDDFDIVFEAVAKSNVAIQYASTRVLHEYPLLHALHSPSGDVKRHTQLMQDEILRQVERWGTLAAQVAREKPEHQRMIEEEVVRPLYAPMGIVMKRTYEDYVS